MSCLKISWITGSRCSTVRLTPIKVATSAYLWRNFLFSRSPLFVCEVREMILISSIASLIYSLSLISFSMKSPFSMSFLKEPENLKDSMSLSISISGYSLVIISCKAVWSLSASSSSEPSESSSVDVDSISYLQQWCTSISKAFLSTSTGCTKSTKDSLVCATDPFLVWGGESLSVTTRAGFKVNSSVSSTK